MYWLHGTYPVQPPKIKQANLSLWSILERNGSLLTHSRDDGDGQVLTVVELGLDLVTQVTIWDLDIVLGVTVVGHQGQETVIDVQQLELGSLDVWNLHVVGRWRQVLQLLTSENVNGDQVNLGVTVLTGLRSGHVDNLTWSTLDDNVTVLSQSRTLHWEGQSGTGIGGLKGVLKLVSTLMERQGKKMKREEKKFSIYYHGGYSNPKRNSETHLSNQGFS